MPVWQQGKDQVCVFIPIVQRVFLTLTLSSRSAGPVVPLDPPYNYDVLSMWDTSSVEQALKGKVVISSAYLIPDPEDPDAVAEAEQMSDWFKDFVHPDENPLEPLSEVYFPIIDQTDSVIIKNHESLQPG